MHHIYPHGEVTNFNFMNPCHIRHNSLNYTPKLILYSKIYKSQCDIFIPCAGKKYLILLMVVIFSELA